jgi:hypothetical protein
MSIGGWQPDDATMAMLHQAQVTRRIEPEDVAAFTTYFAGRWFTPADAGRRFTGWMIRDQKHQRGSSNGKASTGSRGQSAVERNRAGAERYLRQRYGPAG